MGARERRHLQQIYDRTGSPEKLPWHREDPPVLLEKAISTRPERGLALDLGCGAGVFSCYLARQGYRVTALDFVEEALRMARARARSEHVEVRFLQADILSWDTPDRFELVLDSGCLHSLHPSERPTYRRQLLRWLAPSGDYVLVHFAKRHFFDWRPVGPRRRRREDIVPEFSPELVEQGYQEILETGMPLPVGPTCLIGSYWFRRRAES